MTPLVRQAKSAIDHSGRFSERIATRSPRLDADGLEPVAHASNALEQRGVRDRRVLLADAHLHRVGLVVLLDGLEQELVQRPRLRARSTASVHRRLRVRAGGEGRRSCGRSCLRHWRRSENHGVVGGDRIRMCLRLPRPNRRDEEDRVLGAVASMIERTRGVPLAGRVGRDR